MTSRKEKPKLIDCLVLALAILVTLKSVFADFNIDTEYAVAMSYRMLRGDRMFAQMWEPHQTSAYLATAFMWLFVSVTGSFTGVIVYLHIVGAILHGIVTRVMYVFLRKRLDRQTARLMALFFFVVRPKDILYPEYTNMQIWFSTLLFLSLMKFLEQQDRKIWLILAAVCLCLEVIAYPSCMVVVFGVIAILVCYGERKGRDIVIFLTTCLVSGCAYIAFFVARLGFSGFGETVRNIILGDSSHDAQAKAISMEYFECFLYSFLGILGALAAAVLCNFLFNKLFRNKEGKERIVFLFAILMIMLSVAEIFLVELRNLYVGIYVVVILLGLYYGRSCEGRSKMLYTAGSVLSAGSFLATTLLTNLSLIDNVMYLQLGVMVAFIPLSAGKNVTMNWGKRRICCNMLLLFCMGIMLCRGLTVKTDGGFSRPQEIGGIVKDGPAKYILTDYMGAHIINESIPEFEQYTHPGDNILIVGNYAVKSLGYLYVDTGVGGPSTICTPTYDETLLRYWEIYPDKYPDCVIVECWQGELKPDPDSFIMRWLEKEYSWSECDEGVYWRYYHKNQLTDTSPLL